MSLHHITNLIQLAGYQVVKKESDLEVTERKNKEKQARIEKERAEANKKVLKEYNIKK